MENKPIPIKEIRFSMFVLRKVYSVKIEDIWQGDIKQINLYYKGKYDYPSCDYIYLPVIYLQDYPNLKILKGEIINTYFPLHTFIQKLDYTLRKDGKNWNQFIKDTRYDLFIDFIRHDKYWFEILKYSFDPAYAKI